MRSISLFLLLFLLLEPVLKSETQFIDDPEIIISYDNSRSIIFNNDSNELNNVRNTITDLETKLSEDYDVRSFSFGESLREGLVFDQSDRETNLSELFDGIDQRYQNKNVGAMIVVSDGIYNRGINPIYQRVNFNFPVHILAIGDTLKSPDISINNVRHNDIAYLGNDFPIRVELTHYGLGGEEFQISVFKNGKEVKRANGLFFENEGIEEIDFLMNASESGVQQYEIKVTTSGKEKNINNNNRVIFIDVLDGRQRILLLANSPHPDLGALYNAISKYEQYELVTKTAKTFDDNIEGYDLVIFHNWPGNNTNSKTFDKIKKGEFSKLFIIGNQVNSKNFNELNTGLNINIRNSNSNQSIAKPNEGFSLFNTGDDPDKFSTYPPLSSPFGQYSFETQNDVLFYQKIGNVNTREPLLSFAKSNNTKTGFLIGEGIWRWRIWEYKSAQSHEFFDSFIQKVIQYLAVKTDKSRLRISGKKKFLENEKIIFDGELYNEAYELVNDKEIKISVQDSSGKDYEFVMSPTSNAYRIDMGLLPIGTYTYTASVNDPSFKLNKSGKFIVSKVQLESFKTVADHQTLFNLAGKFNGKFFNSLQTQELIEEIQNDPNIKPISHVQVTPEELINKKWLFFFLLIFLSTEWFFRKRLGSY